MMTPGVAFGCWVRRDQPFVETPVMEAVFQSARAFAATM
jgi:hypothetical protein